MHTSTAPPNHGGFLVHEISPNTLTLGDAVWISCDCKTEGFHKVDKVLPHPNKNYVTVVVRDQSYDPAIKCRSSVMFYKHGTAIVKCKV